VLGALIDASWDGSKVPTFPIDPVHSGILDGGLRGRGDLLPRFL
jgi:hypothetical protein